MGPLLLLLVALATPAGAPEDPPLPDDDPIERLEAWPELTREERDEAEVQIGRLRKPGQPEMNADGRARLLELGAGVVPRLLPKLAKAREEAELARLRDVLAALTDARHTRLLAAEFDDREPAVRTFAMERASAFPDPGLREAAEEAWERVAKLEEKGRAEPAEVYAAALVLTSSGSTAGLEVLLDRARTKWHERGPAMRAALAGARGPEATRAVLAAMEGADRTVVVAGLHLLAGCGDPATAPAAIRPWLDESDSQILVASINALRAILDGAEPLDRLPTFEAIERAGKWKERLGG